MKKRKSLLVGLGIMMILSTTVPVFATSESSDDESALVTLEESEETVEESYEWKQDETDGRWYLLDTSDKDHIKNASEGIYETETGYYSIDKNGYLETGFIRFTFETESGSVDVIYYFNPEGDDPKSGLGAMLFEQWAPETLVTEKGLPVWCWLDEYGEVVDDLQAVGKDGWQQPDVTSDKWYFLRADGTVDTEQNGWSQSEDGVWLNGHQGEAVVITGWQQIAEKTWYHLDEEGKKDNNTVGKYEIEDAVYYLDAEGVAQTGHYTVDGVMYYFDASTGKATEVVIQNGWQQIDGNWYWIENGKAASGWRSINGKWYYMDPATNVMMTGFFTAEDGKTYYCDGSGAMKTGWLKLSGQWYYFSGSGAMQEGWLNLGGSWYYLTPESGIMKTGWYQVNNVWYYSDSSGAMKTGWLNLGGTWYYLAGSGAMQEGWIQLSGKWYYLTPGSGAMKTGWYQVNNVWYYSDGSGAMAANRWVGNYYLTGSGAMATSTWIGPYYVGADGKWIPNYGTVYEDAKWVNVDGKWYYELKDGTYYKKTWLKIDGKWYSFEADGTMVTGWKYIGGYKYYFGSNGALVQDLDSVIGRQSSYYITVNRAKCQVTVYAQDGAGNYIIPVKTFACSVGLPGTPTPTGTFKTSEKKRWHTLMGPSYGQYCTRIVGGILFHSVAGSNQTSYNLSAAEYNKLGSPASHGCVRLCVRDAKWIYDNCPLKTTVTISDTAATPFDKPATIKIPASQNWDPTDPNVKK
ncbi:MAG: L,D-transpeptidase family protein [Oliverpabstia sp.]|nr:L,D-transpeptidase family protein [Lachnospiraceae bacterium]MDY5025370.1 L,D-transpeptidase family protein [Oliverpabstia sp.]